MRYLLYVLHVETHLQEPKSALSVPYFYLQLNNLHLQCKELNELN